MGVIGETWKESLRLARAAERLNAVTRSLVHVAEEVDQVAEVAPDLLPELAAVRERLDETGAHLSASYDVIMAKLDLLQDRFGPDREEGT